MSLFTETTNETFKPFGKLFGKNGAKLVGFGYLCNIL